jgi:hypothetical protein
MPQETARINHSNTTPTQSHHIRASPKLVSHHVDSDKKIRKQIRNIEKAIKEENTRPGKANAGILKGLKKALAKLNATRTLRDQSSLSQTRRGWKQSSSPEKQAFIVEQLCQEPIQTATPPETQQSPARIKGSQLYSNTPTVEERLSTLLAPASQQSLAESQPTDFRVSTSESKTIMAESSLINGEKNHEKREPASADHNMTPAENAVVDYFPLTEECHHYTRRSDIDWDIQK